LVRHKIKQNKVYLRFDKGRQQARGNNFCHDVNAGCFPEYHFLIKIDKQTVILVTKNKEKW